MRVRATSRIDRTAMLLAVVSCGLAAGAVSGAPAPSPEAGVIVSHRAPADFALTADPSAPQWKNTAAVVADKDRYGQLVPGHRTEIRSRWTEKNLYFLFVCPYEALNLKPEPSTAADTDKLWEWDVAEAFIGTNFEDIKKYTEFQVSPQGEWVDLAIDRGVQPAIHDTKWNSGYEVKARLARGARVWYGEMRIPMATIDTRPPKAGQEMRINFYRIQGPGPDRKHVNWQVVNKETYHTPEAFGRLRLQD